MKYYLHRAVAHKPKDTKKFKITEYTIQEFESFKKALEVYKRDFLLEGDIEQRGFSTEKKIAMRITTTKKKIRAKLYKPPLRAFQVLTLNPPTSKYRCCREYLETDPEYGVAQDIFLILETNYQKACDEFLYEMKKYEDKRNSFFIEIGGNL
ncbi:MAG: hypothetical protein ACRC8M_13630 [Cetobacterium sp.]|uniref:hypothetical protein n=1 Tax=Cetobacterium sp. TaxID=2071632 RepID=UPI003F34DA02